MKTRKIKRLTLFSLLVMLSFSIFSACDKNESKQTIVHGNSSNVMTVHASPDASTVSFYLGDTKITNTALSYGDHTTYVSTPSGKKKAEFRGGDTNTAIASSDLDLVDKKNYTIFLAGPVAAASVIAVEDDLAAPGAGKAKVRFVNLSPDDAKLDIRVKGGDKLATSREYKSVSNFVDVNPGAVTYEVLDQASTVLFTSQEFNLQEGKIYTIWIKGSANGTGDAALGTRLIQHN